MTTENTVTMSCEPRYCIIPHNLPLKYVIFLSTDFSFYSYSKT